MLEDDSVFAAMRAGARGHVLKEAEQAKIVQAIQVIQVIAGGEAILVRRSRNG
jgi:DNA-binding NarL/FixJ family response regulator